MTMGGPKAKESKHRATKFKTLPRCEKKSSPEPAGTRKEPISACFRETSSGIMAQGLTRTVDVVRRERTLAAVEKNFAKGRIANEGYYDIRLHS